MQTNAEQLLNMIKKEGVSLIVKFIDEHVLETRFLDFKEKKDSDGVVQPNESDKRNLAKALSGFANAEGGLLIWGVGEQENENGIKVASADKSITGVEDFVRRLEHLLPNAVTRPIEGAYSFPVKKINSHDGFAITYVPESNLAPHRAGFHLKEYYLRVGDNFIPMEHYQIEDMFGRRQRPSVSARFEFKKVRYTGELHIYDLIIDLMNDGRSMASFVGVDFEFPVEALKGENRPLSRYKIDQYYDVEQKLALIKLRYNSREEGKAPLFPREVARLIPDNFNLGHISYHVDAKIHGDWNGRELNVTIYSDSASPKESKINFDDLNEF